MRHARDDDLDGLDDLLARLRTLPGPDERRRGVFYRGSSPFLHFHADPAGMFADLKAAGRWRRYRADRSGEQRTIVADARRVLRGETTGLRGHARS